MELDLYVFEVETRPLDTTKRKGMWLTHLVVADRWSTDQQLENLVLGQAVEFWGESVAITVLARRRKLDAISLETYVGREVLDA